MLLSTDLLNDEERLEAQAATPWSERAERLAGPLRAALDNGSVDVMEIALGPSHVRSGLVTLYEGADVLLQATMDVAETVAREQYFTRVVPLNPLGVPEPLPDGGRHRYPRRLARFALEDAAIKLATAGDHFVNASLRFAWEANASLESEAKSCRFDPGRVANSWWASVDDVAKGLDKLARAPLPGPLLSFRLMHDFRTYHASPGVRESRAFRDRAVHGERLSYKETKAFGRSTIWAKSRIQVKFPPDPEPDPTAPSLAEIRAMVSESAIASLAFGEAVWAFAQEWLRSLDVWITLGDRAVQVETRSSSPRWTPRERRDPGPWLLTP